MCLFLKRGATQNDEDEDGQDPLSIAVQQANADIVTLYVDRYTPPVKCLLKCVTFTNVVLLLSSRLRLARMNEEMRESEGPFGQPGQYPASSPTEQQYKKCIQEFICLNITEC